MNGSRYRPIELAVALVFVVGGLVALGVLFASRPCITCPILRTSASVTVHGQVTS